LSELDCDINFPTGGLDGTFYAAATAIARTPEPAKAWQATGANSKLTVLKVLKFDRSQLLL
jgi:hypothetical protein